MKTCGTCKFFGESYTLDIYDEDGNDVSSPVYHTCNLLPHLNASGRAADAPSPWPMAGVTDGSGYFAAFKVREDFGCNQWSCDSAGAKQP